MAWEEKKEPKYEVNLSIEGIKLLVQYDVANMSPDDEVWDDVKIASDIYVKKILHEGTDIKRLVRGYPKHLINDLIFETY